MLPPLLVKLTMSVPITLLVMSQFCVLCIKGPGITVDNKLYLYRHFNKRPLFSY